MLNIINLNEGSHNSICGGLLHKIKNNNGKDKENDFEVLEQPQRRKQEKGATVLLSHPSGYCRDADGRETRPEKRMVEDGVQESENTCPRKLLQDRSKQHLSKLNDYDTERTTTITRAEMGTKRRVRCS